MLIESPFSKGLFVYGVFDCEANLAREQDLHSLVEPAVAALGFVLWGLEHNSQGRHTLLRIFIDSDKGITVDDCAEVSRQVSAVFDVEDPITGEYTLEVSSPGVNRSLFNLEQYQMYIGEPLQLRLRAPYEGRRKFKGILSAVEGEDIVLRIDDDEYLLPFGSIDKAVIEPVIRPEKKKS
ncbi:MAG: ribosome maturation factor RimP [Halieaceae bacterium]|jgi:ribosome maturation factor RimP